MVWKRSWPALALVGAVLCWTGNYMVGGLAAASMPLSTLLYLKWGICAGPLLLVAWRVDRPDWAAVLRCWKRLTILSCLGIAGYSFALFQALRTETALHASLINALNPAMIAVASAIFLRERLMPLNIAGLAIALLGMLWVSTGGHLGALSELSFHGGDLWMLGAITCWTAYNIIVKSYAKLPELTSCALQMVIFTLLMTPVVLINGLTLPHSRSALLALAYVAVFPSAVAYVFWNYGAQKVEASAAGQSLNLVVPFAAIMTFMMGSPVSSVDIESGVLILLGVYMSTASVPAFLPGARRQPV